VAALLAGVWLLAGLLALFLAFARHRWFGLMLGPIAVAYGVLWVRVAQTGRRLQWPVRPHRR
jgi:hypothetical protein